ncbi:MAG: bifunctional riboflavin kinase/FAD synthetase [Lachnospiraceae bacterium]|nr:bifunctional riboflavin kinase/FAD synthetase [Lachnospiraceae bacterium]
MKIINDIKSYNAPVDAAVTVGKFDGLHRGHQRLIERLSLEKKQDMPIIAVTFDVSPDRILSDKGDETRLLFTNEERRYLARKSGADILIIQSFTEDFMHLLPEEFIRLLYDKLHMRLFACGSDFHFGYKGQGDTGLLRSLSERMGFKLIVEEKLKDESEDISSSRIRKAVTEGDLATANRLLGTPYIICGEVVHGKHLGTGMGFPTINIVPSKIKLLPSYGVYISIVEIEGHKYHGVTDIGVKPTVAGDISPVVETHILDFNSSIYGKNAVIELLEYVRGEKKFDSIEALKQQINADKKRAYAYFSS